MQDKPKPSSNQLPKEEINNIHKPLIDYSTLPVIQHAVSRLSPTLDEKFDISVIQRICVLARNQVTKERVLSSIRKDGIDPTTIPEQGNALSLLVNDDQVKRIQTCAAWIAQSAMDPINKDGIFVTQTQKVREVVNRKTIVNTIKHDVFDKPKAFELMSVKLSILRANAELYASIAQSLSKTPGLTLDEYEKKASEEFAARAPLYLKRVQELYYPDADAYHLTQYDNGNYNFYTDNGYRVIRNEGNVYLTFRGINWLAHGEIMGKEYFIKTGDLYNSENSNNEGTRKE